MAFQPDVLGPNCSLWRFIKLFLTTLSSLTEDQSFTVLCNIKEKLHIFYCKMKRFWSFKDGKHVRFTSEKALHLFKMNSNCI